MAVSFVLSNADFFPLLTVSKLPSTSIIAFSGKHISNTTAVTPFSKTVLPISKNFLPEDLNLFDDYNVTHNFELKGILLIMFYINFSCRVIPSILYHQLMLQMSSSFCYSHVSM